MLKSSSMQQTDSFLSFMAKPTSATAPRSADWYRRLQRYSLARLQRAARDNLSSGTSLDVLEKNDLHYALNCITSSVCPQ